MQQLHEIETYLEWVSPVEPAETVFCSYHQRQLDSRPPVGPMSSNSESDRHEQCRRMKDMSNYIMAQLTIDSSKGCFNCLRLQTICHLPSGPRRNPEINHESRQLQYK